MCETDDCTCEITLYREQPILYGFLLIKSIGIQLELMPLRGRSVVFSESAENVIFFLNI